VEHQKYKNNSTEFAMFGGVEAVCGGWLCETNNF